VARLRSIAAVLAAALALAVWVLVAARDAALARVTEELDARARAAAAIVQAAAADLLGALARGGGALVDAQGRFLEPPEPREMSVLTLPPGRDDEGSWLLAAAEAEETRESDAREAERLYRAASDGSRAALCRGLAQARLAAFHRRAGDLERAHAADSAFLAELEHEERCTREALLARALLPEPDGELQADLLLCIGGADEAIALGLLEEAGLANAEAVAARRAELALIAQLRPLVPTADAPDEGLVPVAGGLAAWVRDELGRTRVERAPWPELGQGVRLLAPHESGPGGRGWVRFAPAGRLLPGSALAATASGAQVRAVLRARLLSVAGGLAALLVAGGLALGTTWRAVQRERAAAAQQSAFVARVGHDLRTPLAVIRLYAETLAGERARDGREAREFARVIAGEAERLGGMVDAVLDLARLGEAGVGRGEVELVRLAREVGEANRALLAEVGLTLELVLPGAAVHVLGDEDALRGALGNLLENARHHAPGSGAVELGLRVEQEEVILAVSDRGPGLPAELGARVFERFVRGSAASARGVGLGLALVREVAEAHGGRALARPRDGGGTVFELRLPGRGEREP